MKKFLVVAIFVFFLFGFNGSSDAASLIEDLKNFESSLSEWVANFDKLEQRLSNLENDEEAEDKQIADFNRSIANIEKLLANIDAKVNKIEKMGSVSGVRDILKNYEGTLDVFKKRFSGMAKRVEDQEVKTAVLERIYKTAQEPLETLMAAIDEQKEIVNNLVERSDKQEKALWIAQQSLKKQTLPIETLVKSIEELNARLDEAVAGTLVLKEEEKKELEETSKEVHGKVEEKHEAEVVASEVHHEEAKTSTEKISEMEGFINIGKGVFIKNVEFKPFGSSSSIEGEIMNKTDRDYGMAEFKVQAYNEEGVPLGGHSFSVKGFKRDSTKTFEEIIVGVEPKKIAKYAIFSAEMPLISATGEEEIRIIERKSEVALAETKETHPQLTEKEITHEKEKRGITKELEGFEDLGGGFYARNVLFTSFGSSSTMTGEIKNNSKDNFNLASFVIKIYSKNYGMITSFDFSVRRLKSGDIRPFKEMITGVRTFEIFRYEIAFKESSY